LTSWNFCEVEEGAFLVNPFNKWHAEVFWKPFLRSVRSRRFKKNLSTVGTERLNVNFDRTWLRTTSRSRILNVCKVRRWLEALETCQWAFKICHKLQYFKLYCKIRGLFLT
jgi:hypothetical protein